MILSCNECSRQYRVEKYPPGQHVRCLCGNAMTVPEPHAHQARNLHCADCGGPLGQDASQCDYCGGVLDPQTRNYTQICPKCFARLPETARFCIECAQPIRPQEVVEHHPSNLACPRCQTPLQARAAEAIGFHECPSCLGLWLPADAFKLVCDMKVAQFQDNPLPAAHRGSVGAAPVVYLKCPDCQNMMNRENFGRISGVLIDQCRAHGVWLDNTELERIARFIAEGGLARSRKREVDDLERRAREAELKAQATWNQPSHGRGVGLLSHSSVSTLGDYSLFGALSRLLD